MLNNFLFTTGYATILNNIVSAVPLDPPLTTVNAANHYHAFGFDRLVEGFTGDTAKFSRAPHGGVSDEASFGTTSEGIFDFDSLETWRAGADVDVIEFYDQTGNGATGVVDGEAAVIRSNIVNRMGNHYEETDGAEQSITAITKAAAAQITVPSHGLMTDDVVYIGSVGGMTEITGIYARITVIDNDNFTVATVPKGQKTIVDIDSTAYTTYTSGGYVKLMKRELLTRSTTLGGIAANLASTGAIKVDNTTIDVSGSGLEVYMLSSFNTRKIQYIGHVNVVDNMWGGNNSTEYLMSYGNGTNNVRFTMLGSFGSFAYINFGGGSDNAASSLGTIKQHAQNLFELGVDQTSVKTSLNSQSRLNKTLQTANQNAVTNGDIDNQILLLGANFSGNDPHASNRPDMMFSGAIVTSTLSSFEKTLVRAKLALVGQQHRTKSLAQITGFWDEILVHEDINVSTGELVGKNNKMTLTYNVGTNSAGTTNAVFNHQDTISGVTGVNFPSQNNGNGFIANNNYFGDVTTGTIFAVTTADFPHLGLGYAFCRDNGDGFHTTRGQGSLALGRDHAKPTLFSKVSEEHYGGAFVMGSRTFSDGTSIGDALSDQAMLKYDRNTLNGTLSLTEGTAFSYSDWSWDSLLNNDPNAPYTFNAPIKPPTAQNEALVEYNDNLLLHVGTFKKSDDYVLTDDALTRADHRLKSYNESYVASLGSIIGNVTGDIAINERAGVAHAAANSKIMSNRWYSVFQGTAHAFGFLPNVVLTKSQIEEFHMNFYKLFDPIHNP